MLNFLTIKRVITASIQVAKRHSADIERTEVSVILKTDNRQYLRIDTENLHLYIHQNIPSLYLEWDSVSAMIKWIKRQHRMRESPEQRSSFIFLGFRKGKQEGL